MNKRDLITQLMATGTLDDEVQIVNRNTSEDDEDNAREVKVVETPEEDLCYIYYDGDED